MNTYYITTECVVERTYTVKAGSADGAVAKLKAGNFTHENEEISASDETITDVTRDE